jgi:hypothetical protein
MPIEKEEFQDGKPRSKLEDDIILFLKERGEKAYTSEEIMGGLEYFHTDFSNPDIAQMSTFAIADFTALLYDLVNKRRITMKAIKGQMHFLTAEDTPRRPKCPKCDTEIGEPKKTWMMTRRPDKEGRRLQLHIGLFECPTHGVFRTVLNKQKI